MVAVQMLMLKKVLHWEVMSTVVFRSQFDKTFTSV